MLVLAINSTITEILYLNVLFQWSSIQNLKNKKNNDNKIREMLHNQYWEILKKTWRQEKENKKANFRWIVTVKINNFHSLWICEVAIIFDIELISLFLKLTFCWSIWGIYVMRLIWTSMNLVLHLFNRFHDQIKIINFIKFILEIIRISFT